MNAHVLKIPYNLPLTAGYELLSFPKGEPLQVVLDTGKKHQLQQLNDLLRTVDATFEEIHIFYVVIEIYPNSLCCFPSEVERLNRNHDHLIFQELATCIFHLLPLK